jgi:hypothetical protein
MEELVRVLSCIVHEKQFSKGIVGRAIQRKDHFFFSALLNSPPQERDIQEPNPKPFTILAAFP